MKLLVCFGEPEVKHWPAPFCDFKPALECLLAGVDARGRDVSLVLPGVRVLRSATDQSVQIWSAEALRQFAVKSRALGYPGQVACIFAGGRMVFDVADVMVGGPLTIAGELYQQRGLALESGLVGER